MCHGGEEPTILLGGGEGGGGGGGSGGRGRKGRGNRRRQREGMVCGGVVSATRVMIVTYTDYY